MLSQAQLATLFEKDSDTIGLHLKNIYKEGELDPEATTEQSSVVRQEGNRQVRRNIRFYNLDAIISVGYRVNSKKGTQFRIWATQRLREYLVQGYTLNQERFDKNSSELQQALNLIRKTAQSPELKTDEGRGLVEIISVIHRHSYGYSVMMKACLIILQGRMAVSYPVRLRRWQR
ncbi:RhuM family protein [Psychrobacter sp. JCM 18903]|uniref:virulence RhuM family protein n=1 Tax=Psychrobacter sp. JCM 18903 TaxID=1298610 RepID=UPI001FB11CEB|nr:RhuM family protein [Psychrobacter sp. JCM 18903]